MSTDRGSGHIWWGGCLLACMGCLLTWGGCLSRHLPWLDTPLGRHTHPLYHTHPIPHTPSIPRPTPPHVDRMTDKCKNITFPASLRHVVGKKLQRVGIELGTSAILVWCSPIWANLALLVRLQEYILVGYVPPTCQPFWWLLLDVSSVGRRGVGPHENRSPVITIRCH